MTEHPLYRLFNPRSIAVVGASKRELTIGYRVLVNILRNGYRGRVFPVNPKEKEIAGIRAYPSVLDLPGEVDIANISIRNSLVPDAVRECGEKGVKFVIIHTAGFREVGGEGAILEDEVMEMAERYGVRVYGPNSQGVMNSDPGVSLYANFTFTPMNRGNISIIAQSGGVAEVLNLNLRKRGYGFRMYASNGNARDVSIPEILDFFGRDPETGVILLHIESIKDPSPFMETVLGFIERKPVLAIKSGKTEEAARAISSHTGSLMEKDTLTDSIFERCGILRFHNMEEMVDCAIALSSQPLPKGRKVGIITNAGGPGIVAVDESVERGFELPPLSEPVRAALKTALPPEAYAENPVDISATSGAPEFGAAVSGLLEDPGIDAVILNMITPFFVDCGGAAQEIVKRVNEGRGDKPALVTLMTNETWEPVLKRIRDGGIPVYDFPESAVKAIEGMVRYREVLEGLRREREEDDYPFEPDREGAGGIIMNFLEKAGRGYMEPGGSFSLLEGYGIRTARFFISIDEGEIKDWAMKNGFPVVLKLAGVGIHKTEERGVILDIRDEAELQKGVGRLRERFGEDAPLLVQEFVRGGKEYILGIKGEAGSGSLVMAGTGGIYAEVLRDTCFSLAPVKPWRARRMIEGLRSFPLLKGVRGEPPSDFEALVRTLTRLSILALDFPEIREMDINPVIVLEEGMGCIAVDVRVRVEAIEEE